MGSRQSLATIGIAVVFEWRSSTMMERDNTDELSVGTAATADSILSSGSGSSQNDAVVVGRKKQRLQKVSF